LEGRWKARLDPPFLFLVGPEGVFLPCPDFPFVRAVVHNLCRSIAAAGFDATASILSFKNDELAIVASLDLHESEVKSVSYSPSGALLATCSRDKVVYIWESGMDDDFECIAVLNGHKQDVKDVVWHPTAELLASASYDDSIRLWKEDYDEWYCCAKLSGHTSTVWSLSFDEKGDRLASVSADRQLIVWRQSSKEGKPLGSDPQWREVWKTDESEHKRPIYSVGLVRARPPVRKF